MKKSGLIDLILDFSIVGGVLAFLFFWYKNNQTDKAASATYQYDPVLKLNPLKVSTKGVKINGASWGTYVQMHYVSNVAHKKAYEVVEDILAELKTQSERYKEVENKRVEYKTTDIASTLVYMAIDQAVALDYIDKKLASG